MGRGPAWGEEDLQLLRAYAAAGKGPSYVKRHHEEWSLSSIKKAMAKINNGLLENRYLPALRLCAAVRDHGVWQEDNAPSHRAKAVLAWKAENWPFEELDWPASSPDLSPLDYSLWSLLENRLRSQVGDCAAAQQLKMGIADAVAYYNTEGWPEVQKALESFPRRLAHCAAAGGGSL